MDVSKDGKQYGIQVGEAASPVIATSECLVEARDVSLDENEDASKAELAPGDFRRNTGSYRKRKAKKQVGVERTVEDLRGTPHSLCIERVTQFGESSAPRVVMIRCCIIADVMTIKKSLTRGRSHSHLGIA